MNGESPQLIASDLAPGDIAARGFDWSATRVVRVRAAQDPLFPVAYQRLWAEFAPRSEMELQEVIRTRLGWRPGYAVNGHALRYEMLVIERGGMIAAVRDHTVIVPSATPARAPEVIVHLSHVLVEPPWRGTGLSAWLRALPIRTAIEAARSAFGSACAPLITLVGEMEHPAVGTAAAMASLRSYERAGFLKIDPQRVRYAQPDFRRSEEIDGSAVRPVPLALVIRRVGREDERRLAVAEVRRIVAALHAMFAATLPARCMQPLSGVLDELADGGDPVALVRPTQ